MVVIWEDRPGLKGEAEIICGFENCVGEEGEAVRGMEETFFAARG